MRNKELNGLATVSQTWTLRSSSMGKEQDILLLCSDLESGYYSRQNFPPNEKSQFESHYYLIVKTKNHFFMDAVLRIQQQLSQKKAASLSILPGIIGFNKKEQQVVRISRKTLPYLQELCEALNEHDIAALTFQEVAPFETEIRFKKSFNLTPMEESTWKDQNNQYRYFFPIDQVPDLTRLKIGFNKIKSNCNFHLFDYSTLSMFTNGEWKNFIGIYSQHCDESRFDELKLKLSETF